ncbi:MAG TPA: aminoacyl-tRNA hydrolase [Candidatus Saccharimonadales bacterium]|nr:aminoacyl-tRNA hydrolase [Candidatus Saccharimonadales bacterium]
MALFQRKPQLGESIQYYTLGQNKTILLVGLGNIGKDYDDTRHNVGFACIDHFVDKTDDMGGWIDKKDLKCHMSTGRIGQAQVIAIKPTTLMNLSGEAVQAAAHFYRVPDSQIVVIHDELDIAFGQIRMRVGGSSAGHNGIKSVTQAIGENYGRVRIGIGPKKPAQIDSADFVLQKFSKKELEHMPALVREVTAILSEYLYGGELPHDTRSFLI